MKKVYVVVKSPGNKPTVQYIDDSLEALQSLVGGYLEEIQLTGILVLLCNDAGRRLRLQDNVLLPVGKVSGTVIVVAHDRSGDLRSLDLHEQEAAKASLERVAL